MVPHRLRDHLMGLMPPEAGQGSTITSRSNTGSWGCRFAVLVLSALHNRAEPSRRRAQFAAKERRWNRHPSAGAGWRRYPGVVIVRPERPQRPSLGCQQGWSGYPMPFMLAKETSATLRTHRFPRRRSYYRIVPLRAGRGGSTCRFMASPAFSRRASCHDRGFTKPALWR